MSSALYTMKPGAMTQRTVKRQIGCAAGWLKRAEMEAESVERLRLVFEALWALQRATGGIEDIENGTAV